MPDKKIRTAMSVPVTHYKIGALWAWLKGRPIATLASDVFQARTEASENQQWIEKTLAERANDMQITVEELKQRIWSEAGLTTESLSSAGGDE
ncbi:MAG TPA: hypothetical protein V6C63_06830 [Allocoleopsis sp.]